MSVVTILIILITSLAVVACYAVIVEYDAWSKRDRWFDRGWKFRVFTMARTGVRVIQRDDGANVEYTAECYFTPIPLITAHLLTSSDLEPVARAFNTATEQRESAIAAHASRRRRSEAVIMDDSGSSTQS